jgi:hypothetical protein
MLMKGNSELTPSKKPILGDGKRRPEGLTESGWRTELLPVGTFFTLSPSNPAWVPGPTEFSSFKWF